MKLEFCFFLGQYLLFSNKYVNSKAVLGPNVRTATEFEFPFVAFITVNPDRYFNINDPYFCTGSIITTQDVLCSEHCLKNKQPLDIQVKVGSYEVRKANTYEVAWWVGYELWAMHKSIPITNPGIDLTIIRLSGNVTDVWPGIVLPLPRNALYDSNVLLPTWGKTNTGIIPRILEVAPLKVLKKEDCEKKYRKLCGKYMVFHDALICTSGSSHTVTDGDYGSPVMFQNKIVGITKGVAATLKNPFHPDQINIHYSSAFFKDFIVDITINCR